MEVVVHRKSFAGPVELHAAPTDAAGGEGTFRATIARITTADGQSVVDLEGDAYVGPQAFPRGKAIVISAYQHGSWEGALPVGYGVVGANQHTAWVTGSFFTNTTPGRDTWLTVKQLAERNLGEWSYGYANVETADNPPPGAKRVIKSMDIFEASPVLVGAGVGTRTEDIKSEEIDKLKELAADVALWSAYGTFVEAQNALDASNSSPAKSYATFVALRDRLRARGITV